MGNKIRKPSFGCKGRYLIPVKIIKGISNSEYEIQIIFDYYDLKKMYAILLNIYY